MPHCLIGQHKFSEVRVEMALRRSYWIVPVAGGLRISIAVEERLDSRRTRPESATAYFVRVGVTRYPIGQSRHARMFRSRTARETRAGKIARSPEKVDRAYLAPEPGTKNREHARCL